MRKTLLYTIVLIFLTCQVSAQVISGLLKNEKGTPVQFASLTLMKSADSTLVSGGLSDSLGAFSIASPPDGRYYLHITLMGDAGMNTPAFEITPLHKSHDLGIITLRGQVKALDGASISAMRPTIVQKVDRLEISIEGTGLAAGNTAFSVLSKIPGVQVDPDGNIQLYGKSGVTIMLDGKPTYLSGSDLRNMLESMSAEQIKNIEIMTNPSAKYDAAGTAGMLNINFKKISQQGMSGSVYANYTYNFKQHPYSAGGNINYKSGKWSSFINLDFAHRAGGRQSTFTRVFYAPTQTTFFDQEATGDYENIGPPAVRLGSDYSIDDRHTIGFTARYANNTLKTDFLTRTYIGNAPNTPYQSIAADNYGKNTFTNYTGNLHYIFKPDTTGSLLSADLDIIHLRNRGSGNFYNSYTDIASGALTQEHLYSSTPNDYYIYAVKGDYTRPLGRGHTLEAGLKASNVSAYNDFRFYINNGPMELDTTRTNHFKYQESIFGAYINLNGKLSKKLSYQAGLRAEQTQSRGESITTARVTERQYLNLFPSIFLQQQVSDNYSIGCSYSRRITRPNYESLNPFRSYRDPYTWTEGNPYLQPEYTHSVSITQTFKKAYILTMSYLETKDVIAELPILDVQKSVTIYTTGNVDHAYWYDFNALIPIKIAKWWEVQNTAQATYNNFTTLSNNGRVVNEQISYTVQSDHILQLPLGIRMDASFMYYGPDAYGLYRKKPLSRVDLGFRKSFLNKQLEVSLKGNDLFAGYRFYWTTNINGNVNEFNQYFRYRNIALSVRYKFSNGQKVEVKSRNTPEELDRTQ